MSENDALLHADTRAQLAGLTFSPDRPLIICDADEVLFMFLEGLERFLNRRDLILDLKSFALTGNIRTAADNRALAGSEVKALLDDFFFTETAHLEPAPGAADALSSLSAHADIVILTNLPHAQRASRVECLARHGMAYPVIANSGPKGPAVAAMIAGHQQPIIFLDDLPPNLQSVAEHAPHVTRIHMIADPRLRRLIPACPSAHARHDDWPDAHAFIATTIGAG